MSCELRAILLGVVKRNALLLLLGLSAALTGRVHAEAPEPLPPAVVVEGEHAVPAPPPRIKLNTVFRVRDGALLWEDAYRRAVDPISALSQPLRISSDTCISLRPSAPPGCSRA